MKLYDKISLAVVSVLLSVFIFATVVSCVLNLTFCNKNYMIAVLERHDYYSLIYKEYTESIEDGIAIPAGVEPGILSNVVSQIEMKNQINGIISAAYDSSVDNSSGFAYKDIEQKFYNSMEAYFISKGFEFNEEVENDIKYVAAHCADECKGYAEMPFIYTIGDYANDFQKVFTIVGFIAGTMIIFLVVLISITKKWRSSALLCSGISCMTAGLMVVIAPLYVLLTDVIGRLNIGVKSLYYFAIGYSTDLLYILILFGLALIIISLVIGFKILIYPLIKRNSTK